MASDIWVITSDSWMNEGNTTSTPGATEFINNQWTVGKDWDIWRSIHLVDFSGTIPAGSTIVSAKLYHWYHSGIAAEDARYQFIRCRRYDTVEADICWDYYKDTTAWGTAGARNVTTDIDAGCLSAEFQHPHYLVSAPDMWFGIDVKDIVEDAIASRSSIFNVVCRHGPTSGETDNNWAAYSKDEAQGPDYRPYLEIEWTPPAGAAIAEISDVAWANVQEVSGEPETHIAAVSGVTAN